MLNNDSNVILQNHHQRAALNFQRGFQLSYKLITLGHPFINPMRSACRLVKMNSLSFIEPIRESVTLEKKV